MVFFLTGPEMEVFSNVHKGLVLAHSRGLILHTVMLQRRSGNLHICPSGRTGSHVKPATGSALGSGRHMLFLILTEEQTSWVGIMTQLRGHRSPEEDTKIQVLKLWDAAGEMALR